MLAERVRELQGESFVGIKSSNSILTDMGQPCLIYVYYRKNCSQICIGTIIT